MILFLFTGFSAGVIAFFMQIFLFLRVDRKKQQSAGGILLFAIYRIPRALFLNDFKSDRTYGRMLFIFRISFWIFTAFLLLSAIIG